MKYVIYFSLSDGEFSRKIKVQCFPLYSVLRAIGNPRVDYFSLDIEGPEFQVSLQKFLNCYCIVRYNVL